MANERLNDVFIVNNYFSCLVIFTRLSLFVQNTCYRACNMVAKAIHSDPSFCCRQWRTQIFYSLVNVLKF